MSCCCKFFQRCWKEKYRLPDEGNFWLDFTNESTRCIDVRFHSILVPRVSRNIEVSKSNSTHTCMRNMTSISSRYRCYRVTRLCKCFQCTNVGHRSGRGLDVSKISLKHFFCEGYAYVLDGVKIITTLVVPLTWKSFRISTVKIGIDCPLHVWRYDVLRCNHP